MAPRLLTIILTVLKKSAPILSILLTKQIRGTPYLSACRPPMHSQRCCTGCPMPHEDKQEHGCTSKVEILDYSSICCVCLSCERSIRHQICQRSQETSTALQHFLKGYVTKNAACCSRANAEEACQVMWWQHTCCDQTMLTSKATCSSKPNVKYRQNNDL